AGNGFSNSVLSGGGSPQRGGDGVGTGGGFLVKYGAIPEKIVATVPSGEESQSVESRPRPPRAVILGRSGNAGDRTRPRQLPEARSPRLPSATDVFTRGGRVCASSLAGERSALKGACCVREGPAGNAHRARRATRWLLGGRLPHIDRGTPRRKASSCGDGR